MILGVYMYMVNLEMSIPRMERRSLEILSELERSQSFLRTVKLMYLITVLESFVTH